MPRHMEGSPIRRAVVAQAQRALRSGFYDQNVADLATAIQRRGELQQDIDAMPNPIGKAKKKS